jgi:CDP-4-dehydro-6-deoxyglucose reductase/ferredoxin-NAD(P)+ reductase (naphthalene dioxygenase ferredoxin-specific)
MKTDGAPKVPYKIEIRNVGRTVEADDDDNVMSAAILAGIDYPSGCQSGNCGSCKSELLSGSVKMSNYSRIALKREERAQGLILACRAVPKSDCDVAWLEPDEYVEHPRNEHDCRVAAIEAPTHDVRIVRLNIGDGGALAFSAGQFATLRFGNLPGRDYSMANPPSTEQLEFHIRALPDGLVSEHVAQRLRIGDAVRVVGPSGTAHLRQKHRRPILAIAGSTGLAPLLSIIQTAIEANMPQPIQLYFGVRQERDLYAMDRLTALAKCHARLTVIPVISEPETNCPCRTGLVTDAVAEDHADLDGAKAYIAGPPAMVEAALDILQARRMRGQDCHADAFFTEAEKAALP